MGSNGCMNEACRGTTSSEWKIGWTLKSGGQARLCYPCGSAYETSVFCETFHWGESGWRECRICGKRLHCGCIASRYLHDYLDLGGVGCGICIKPIEIHSVQSIQIPEDIHKCTLASCGTGDARPVVVENGVNDDKFTQRLLQLTKAVGSCDLNPVLEKFKQEESILKTDQISKCLINLTQQCSSSDALEPVKSAEKGAGDMHESLAETSHTFSLITPLESSSSVSPFLSGIVEVNQNKVSLQLGQRARQILSKSLKSSSTIGPETNKGISSQTCVARPLAEGRGRSQLFPRYWPRISDQELQQLSGDLKSTVVPLFEKVLSASDAGRIGRLVLPKACAERHFPTINQSEGIPIRFRDIKGNEWTFQFRFWPNNNSRMYVLENITPCMQNMQVQAGDTVIFSRLDPSGKFFITCRKATNHVEVQGPHTPALPSCGSPAEASYYMVADHSFSVSWDTVFYLQFCNHYTSTSIDILGANAKNGCRKSDDSLQCHILLSEKKKARNIKNKRFLMHSDDAMELRITWEEAQELLLPSPSAEPTVVMVENHEFEEFEEPPIFGKRTIFTNGPLGEQEQLSQCDSCLKWRRLPVHSRLSANWTCSENIWDTRRNSCAALEDVNPRDIESSISIYNDSKKRRLSGKKLLKEWEPSGLDALATAAVLGDSLVDISESSAGATTRHPRHRPGCSCIVCIQPPSGKGKHEPTCKCNVCLTVRRRFKTLMMRKKKRQSEREAELLARETGEASPAMTDLESDNVTGNSLTNKNHAPENENQTNLEEMSTSHLDLNCDPHREYGILGEAGRMSLTALMNAATLPLDLFMGHNGIPRITPEREENIGHGEGIENDHES